MAQVLRMKKLDLSVLEQAAAVSGGTAICCAVSGPCAMLVACLLRMGGKSVAASASRLSVVQRFMPP
jgi:hypothetical protein